MSETASPTLQALIPPSEKSAVSRAIKERVPEALFAYGGEVVARPSATGRYVVPDLEMGLQGIDLAYDFDVKGARRREIQLRYDRERGEVIVRMVVPNEVAEEALFQAQQANNTWDLRAFFEAVHGAALDAAKVAGQAAHEAIQSMPKAALESAQISGQAMADVVREASTLTTGPRAMPAIEPAAAPAEIKAAAAPAEVEPLPDDASVAQVATRLAELTGLHDRELGQLFPGQISREHFQRWRGGKSDNPTAANRRRLWFLLRLFERVAQGGVAIREWIRNPTVIEDKTPYDLLRVGRFDEAEYLAARMAPAPEAVEITSAEGRVVLLDQGPPRFTPRSEEPTTDLVFEDDDLAEIEDDEDETDDG